MVITNICEMAEQIVTAKWLNENLNYPDLIILDASQVGNKAGLKTDFQDIQIKGARFFDFKNSFNNKNSEFSNMLPNPQQFEKECRKLGINKSSYIVVYDNLGIYFSPRIWWMFKIMGHEKIAVLNGGLPSWIKEGYEIELTKNNLFEPGNFEAQFRPEKLKKIEFIRENLKNKEAILIDARPENRFKGLEPEPREGIQSGHIPNSINIPFQKVLDNGKFKSKLELIEQFKEIEFDKRPLVFLCGSGTTACIVLLASELIMNNHKAVYDGSWTEWARLEDKTYENIR